MVTGLASVLAVPGGIVLSRYSDAVTLLQSIASAGPGLVLGGSALLLARRGRETAERTLGRAGGMAAARAGRLLGLAGVCVAVTAALAVAFYGLLTLFAD